MHYILCSRRFREIGFASIDKHYRICGNNPTSIFHSSHLAVYADNDNAVQLLLTGQVAHPKLCLVGKRRFALITRFQTFTPIRFACDLHHPPLEPQRARLEWGTSKAFLEIAQQAAQQSAQEARPASRVRPPASRPRHSPRAISARAALEFVQPCVICPAQQPISPAQKPASAVFC